ncbi:MAG: hypothetical protein R2755_26380 [Acidimicrobiales bacterium]
MDDRHDQQEEHGDGEHRLDGGVASFRGGIRSTVAWESAVCHQVVVMLLAFSMTLATMIAPAASANAANMATMITFSVTSPRSSGGRSGSSRHRMAVMRRA